MLFTIGNYFYLLICIQILTLTIIIWFYRMFIKLRMFIYVLPLLHDWPPIDLKPVKNYFYHDLFVCPWPSRLPGRFEKIFAAILDFWPYMCLQICNLRFLLFHTQIKYQINHYLTLDIRFLQDWNPYMAVCTSTARTRPPIVYVGGRSSGWVRGLRWD